MDRSHKLDAPNNDALRTIEQVQDRTGLSSIYRQAHDQWSGELVSKDERDARQKHHQETLSFGIRKHFATISLLLLLPLVSFAIAASFALVHLNDDNVALYVIPAVFGFLVWAGLTILAFKKANRLFYDNALSIGGFMFVLYLLLVLQLPLLIESLAPLHTGDLVLATAYTSAAVLLISLVASGLMVFLWTTPKIHGAVKVGILVGLLLASMVVAITTLLL